MTAASLTGRELKTSIERIVRKHKPIEMPCPFIQNLPYGMNRFFRSVRKSIFFSVIMPLLREAPYSMPDAGRVTIAAGFSTTASGQQELISTQK